MDQTNENSEESHDKLTLGHSDSERAIPEESNTNHCAIDLLSETKDSASSNGLEVADNNHCAVVLKSDSNNRDTNTLSSSVCDIDSEHCLNTVDSTSDNQQDDSALVMSPVSEGSVMDTSGGLETQSEASGGQENLHNTRKDDSGICVERDVFKYDNSRNSADDTNLTHEACEAETTGVAKGDDTEKQEFTEGSKVSACSQDEDIFMDSNEDIALSINPLEDVSKDSDSDQDAHFKDCVKELSSVLDSPKSSDKCHMELTSAKDVGLLPDISCDSDKESEQVGEGATRKLQKKKAKPLVDYDDSDDDTSGLASYDVTKGKQSSDKSNSSSSSSSESEEEMDALNVFLARRKRQMDSDRTNQEDNNDDENDTPGNRNTEENGSRPESEEEEEDIDVGPPRDPWSPLLKVRAREWGVNNRTYGAEKFRADCGASVRLVQRLKRQSKLENHEGCVNALHFNQSGTSLASGSDDLNIVVWDWVHEKPFFTFDSGHRSNVFQCKFMPYTGDSHLVSCARDGQVRLAELSSTGKCKNTKKLAQHKGAAHKLALLDDSSHVFYSCGEDAVVYEVDLRQQKPNKLCTTKEKERKIPLYSIHSNPFKSNEYCVGGRDHFLRVYDKRKMSGDGSGDSDTVKKYCPHHLIDSDIKANVTCAVYNWNGMEVLGTYNDEDIYLFDNTHSDGAEHIGRYTGHRNNATVKGVNFYGPKSEFIVSGSDCGHVFLWEKKSEKIVNYLKGDEAGVVNVLEPHPHMPVLATSGLDHDVKIWAPFAPEPTKLDGLKKLVKKNRKERREERSSDPDIYDGHMLWFLMHHLRRARRMRGAEGGESSTDSDDVERGESDNTDDEEPMQCVPS